MRILKNIPIEGPFTLVWMENGRTVSGDYIADGEKIRLAKMPELADVRQAVIDNMPADVLIITAQESKILVEVDKMPTSGTFVVYWEHQDQVFSETWRKHEDGYQYINDNNWTDVERGLYNELNICFGVWQ